MAARWSEITESTALVGMWRVIIALPVFAVGIMMTAETWRLWVESLHPGLPLVTGYRFFFITQSTKYLPGAIWPFVAQTSLASRVGLPRSVTVAGTGLFLISHVVSGALIGLVLLGTSNSRWMLVVVVVGFIGAAILAPPVTRLAMRVLIPSTSTTPYDARISWTTTLRTTLLMLTAWSTYGVGTFILSEPLGAQVRDLPHVLGAYCVAWVIGLLTPLTPAGLGAREAAFVVLISPTIGVNPSLTLALLTRIIVTVSDLGLAAASTSALRRGHFTPGRQQASGG